MGGMNGIDGPVRYARPLYHAPPVRGQEDTLAGSDRGSRTRASTCRLTVEPPVQKRSNRATLATNTTAPPTSTSKFSGM